MARIELKLNEVCTTRTKCRYVPHSPNTRMHWAEKHRWTDAWKEEVYYSWREHELYQEMKDELPMKKPIVFITYYTCHPMDRDNLYGSAKPVIDGLTEAGIIRDDTEDDITLKVIQKRISTKKEQRVEIKVWEPGEDVSEEERMENLARMGN